MPQLWSGSIIANMQKNCVFEELFNKDYEGEVKQGSSLKLATITNPTVLDYEGIVVYGDVEGTEKTLNISEKKFWGIKVDDVVATQSATNLLSGATRNAGASLSNCVDEYLYGLIDTGATAVGSESVALDGTNGMELLSNIMATLDSKNVPDDNRYVVMSPKASAKILLELAGKLSMNNDLLSSGYFGSIFGLNLYRSNSVPDTNIVAGSKYYGTFAKQLSNTEALRDTNSFSTLVRGLLVYGACLTNTDAFVKQAITIA